MHHRPSAVTTSPHNRRSDITSTLQLSCPEIPPNISRGGVRHRLTTSISRWGPLMQDRLARRGGSASPRAVRSSQAVVHVCTWLSTHGPCSARPMNGLETCCRLTTSGCGGWRWRRNPWAQGPWVPMEVAVREESVQSRLRRIQRDWVRGQPRADRVAGNAHGPGRNAFMAASPTTVPSTPTRTER